MSAPTGMPYGEHQALMQQESSAPMSASATPPPAPSIAPGGAPTSAPGQGPAGVPFGAPTTMPNQPVTHGVDIGLGAGSESLPVEQQPQYAQQGPMTQMLSQLAARDTTGVLAQLYQSARSSGA
jgi:hypothetical protein